MSKVRATALTDETCRQVLRSTAAGTRVRVRLSNRSSPGALRLASLTIGVAAVGAAVQRPRPLLVGGASSTTIPAGGQVTTDPIALEVTLGADIAVSFAVAGSSKPSEHLVAAATGWCTGPGTGDHTRDTSGTAFRNASREGLVLESLDVEGEQSAPGGILAVGDSLTDPPLPPDRYERWTDVLAAQTNRPVANVAIAGNRVLLTGGYGPTLVERFASDVLDRAGASTLILFTGTNDVSAGIAAATLISRLQELCDQAHRAGLRVVLVTLAPAARRPAAREKVRQEVNDWIRTTTAADARLDADALLRDPANPLQVRPAYDLGDGLHLSAAGHRVIGEAMVAAVLDNSGKWLRRRG